MNPTTDPQPPPPPLAPPPQPNRPSISCNLHPDETFTGFCPSCLYERLAVLDSTNNLPSSSSSKKPPVATTSTAVAALKAIFKPSSSGAGPTSQIRNANRPTFLPELRRTKSFSASKNEGLGFSGVFEPQRKSCDVRVRSTLSNLFYQDGERNPLKNNALEAASSELRNLASSSSRPSVHEPVFENETETESGGEIDNDIDVSELPKAAPVSVSGGIEDKVGEIVEEEEIEQIKHRKVLEDEIKTMKDHIDLDSQSKKPPTGRFAGSFWSAASGFSKKLQNWRLKQKLKKRSNGNSIGCSSARLPVEKPIGKQYRETQSEIADYGFGRRSCDTDPRFSLDIGRMSLDAGRMSLDDYPRHSFDEPRASWDSRTFPRMPTMLSVVEDGPALEHNRVLRSDAQIPVEEPTMNIINEVDETVPGGSAQTKEYYSDSRRRKSLDRSNSARKTAAAVVAEIDELKSMASANSKVTPAATGDNFYLNGHCPKLVVPSSRESFRDCNSNSLRDDCSETFEIPFRDNVSVIGNGERKGTSNNKKSMWSKALDILGFIQRRSVNNKEEDEDRYSRANGNGVERSFSESWQEFRSERSEDIKINPKFSRSNSSVSWRNSSNFGGFKKNGLETNGYGKKKKDEVVPERNRSGRYSPNNIENRLLRFHLTPMRGSQRNGGSGKSSRTNQAPSITKSVLRLY